MGIIAKKAGSGGKATAGIVLNILGLVACVIVVIFAVVAAISGEYTYSRYLY